MTAQDNAGIQPAQRWEVFRHLLHPRQMLDSMTLSRQPSVRNASLVGVQAALTSAIAVPAVYLSPWSHLVGFAALGALAALFGRFAPQRQRNGIVFFAALSQTAAVFAMSALGWLDIPLAFKLIALALACGIFYFVTMAGRFGPPGALIFVFAVGASMGEIASFQIVLERSLVTAAAGGLAWLICVATEHFRHHETSDRRFPADPVQPLNHQLIASARIVLAAAFAAFAAQALGAQHPAWAVMGALAVLQGAHLHIRMNRAVQRMAGTMIGALVAWFVLAQEPSFWSVLTLIIILQCLTEVIVGTNYGLAQILITPMALLMTYIALPDVSGPSLAPERVLDTLVGAIIGIAIAVVLSSLDDRRHLAHHVKQRRF